MGLNQLKICPFRSGQMKKILLLLLITPMTLFAQESYQGTSFKTGFIRSMVVFQNWKIDGIDDRIAEGSLPIFINLPVRENMSLQILHSPAISRFGDSELSGLSDTWLRGSYVFPNNRLMLSAGLGIPTGKTELTAEEAALSSIMSQNVFRFRTPVFGQGLTASAGFMYAFPLSDRFTMGSGLNFVFKNKYKITENMQDDFNPGEQMGVTLGGSYRFSSGLSIDLDFIYTYFMADKIEDTEIFKAGNKYAVKGGLRYDGGRTMFLAVGRMRYSDKNDIWDGSALVAEEKNSSLFQMELDAVYRIKFSPLYSLDLLFEGRSYIENEYLLGQADIFGGGLGNNIQLTENWGVNLGFKIFLGDAYYNGIVPNYSGNELNIGTIVRF